MALKERNIETEYLPAQGAVSLDVRQQMRENRVMQKAQENLAINGYAIYAENLDKRLNNEEIKGRAVSYSYAMAMMYSSLSSLRKATKVLEGDSEEKAQNKNTQAQMIDKAVNLITEIVPSVAKQEYPDSEPVIKFGKIEMAMKGNPQDCVIDEQTAQKLKALTSTVTELNDFFIETAPAFRSKALESVKESKEYITGKMNGEDVRAKPKSEEDIIADVHTSIEMLIRDDSASDRKVDRAKAEQDLNKKLSALGMELAVVYVNDNRSEQEILEDQTKTCVLRADYDGFIERPKLVTMCSEAFQSVYGKPVDKVDPRDYKMQDSPVWKICEEMPSFNKLKFNLMQSLASIGFPPDRIKELTYTDIAMAINLKLSNDSKRVAKIQRKGKFVAVDAVRIESGRDKFFKEFANNHEKDLRTLLQAQGFDKEYIDTTIDKMRKGRSVEDLGGHHNFNLSSPSAYEKETGKHWTQMNRDVRLMSNTPHKLLHSIENNVNGAGRIINQDATSSFRTIFTNKASGQKYHYVIRVKDGVDAVLGLTHETIYDKDFISRQTFNTQEQKAVEQNQNTQDLVQNNVKDRLQHVMDRKKQVTETKKGLAEISEANGNVAVAPTKTYEKPHRPFLKANKRGSITPIKNFLGRRA